RGAEDHDAERREGARHRWRARLDRDRQDRGPGGRAREPCGEPCRHPQRDARVQGRRRLRSGEADRVRARPGGHPLMRGALALCCVLSTACATTPRADAAPRARVGPERGTLFIAGGGNLGLDMIERFIQLAGGPDAPIVVIPTAATEDTFPESWP